MSTDPMGPVETTALMAMVKTLTPGWSQPRPIRLVLPPMPPYIAATYMREFRPLV